MYRIIHRCVYALYILAPLNVGHYNDKFRGRNNSPYCHYFPLFLHTHLPHISTQQIEHQNPITRCLLTTGALRMEIQWLQLGWSVDHLFPICEGKADKQKLITQPIQQPSCNFRIQPRRHIYSCTYGGVIGLMLHEEKEEFKKKESSDHTKDCRTSLWHLVSRLKPESRVKIGKNSRTAYGQSSMYTASEEKVNNFSLISPP